MAEHSKTEIDMSIKGNPHIRSYQDDTGKWRWSVIWYDSVMAISPKSYDTKAECDKMAGAMTACVVDIGRRKLIEIKDKISKNQRDNNGTDQHSGGSIL